MKLEKENIYMELSTFPDYEAYMSSVIYIAKDKDNCVLKYMCLC